MADTDTTDETPLHELLERIDHVTEDAWAECEQIGRVLADAKAERWWP